MEPVKIEEVQTLIDRYAGKEVYIHLETTNGSYATHVDEAFFNAGAFIRNAKVTYELGKIIGDSPSRVGLKIELGWIYAQGITHYELDSNKRLIMAGHDHEGKLAVALQISETPFD
ncbi:YojF family protein [Jeotgalibacillus sp. ET6]|uniref:YojF family protein n=1 Tax=Jeotgalibacillus TaxID=157226 RepID=UPI00241879E4|nr:YojF family protein [Jeotgalibacillus sp. ET6]MDG5471094.1 YojF family protein [Jeotgalibacillus sp. ET6]